MKTIKVVVKEPHKDAETSTLLIQGKTREECDHNELKVLQGLVGGYIEVCGLTNDVKIICNEDGLAQNLTHNIGPFVGTIIFVAEQEDEEGELEFVSLNEEQIRKAHAWCRKRILEGAPPVNRGMRIMTDSEEIRRHMELLRAEAESRVSEWESL